MAANLTLDGQTHYAICIALTTLWMLLLAEHSDRRTLSCGKRNASPSHRMPTLHIYGLNLVDTGKGLSSVPPPPFDLVAKLDPFQHLVVTVDPLILPYLLDHDSKMETFTIALCLLMPLH
jgi:hypothetical protein